MQKDKRNRRRRRLSRENDPAGLTVEPPDRERGPEPLFRVVYLIDVNAADRQEAARYVHRIMSDPKSQPPVLHVLGHDGRATMIDLSGEGKQRATRVPNKHF